jgi:secreted trypsin-like serine protease
LPPTLLPRLRPPRRTALLGSALAVLSALVGCAAPSNPGPADDVLARAAVGHVAGRIVGGEQASTGSDSVIRFVRGGETWCTGTLVAPNLVLTARHCVSNLDEESQDPCGKLLGDLDPSTFSVTTGVTPTGSVATGAKIFHDGASNLCGHDLALVLLDREVPNAQISVPRLSNAKKGEAGVAVGYGEDGRGQTPASRFQRANIRVIAVGPANSAYKPQSGNALGYSVAQGEFATGESTCFGDSGGPLFDSVGRVLGVTSRGIDDSCIDRPSIFTSVAQHEGLIRSSMMAAGHPLEASPSETGANDAADITGASSDPASTDADEAPEGDNGASSGSGSATSKKKSLSATAPQAGCSAAPHQRSSRGAPQPLWASTALGLGLLALVARRRRS